MRVVVLHERLSGSGRPDEVDALVQRDEVAAALERLGHEAVPLAVDLDFRSARADLRRIGPAVVFNLVEALDGHASLIHLAPALLDGLGLAYTGCPTAAVHLTSHKRLAKEALARIGLAVPPTWPAARDRCDRWIVKPVWEDASVGIDDASVVDTGDVESALAERRARHGDVFAEGYVDGREFNLSLLADEAGASCLPPAEICFDGFPAGKPRIVGYAAKWETASFEYGHTPRRFDFPPADAALLDTLEEAALTCWTGLGLAGYARVDFRVDARGRPCVLEVNVNPCLAADAGFPAAAARAGLTLDLVVERLLEAALRRASCAAPR